MGRIGRLAALALAIVAGLGLVVRHDDLTRLLGAPKAVTGQWVVDRVDLLSGEDRARVAEYHAALLAAHDIDYRVLALGDGGDLNSNAHGYFESERVGGQSASGRGLLLVIDTALDRVRLEVSTSLEGVYTDAFVAYVENRQMAPFFQTGRAADGILATTEIIVTRAQEARAGAGFVPPMPATSMGGGAAADVSIGAGNVPDAARETSGGEATRLGPAQSGGAQRVDAGAGRRERADSAGLGPLEVVAAYHAAMAARDARSDLPIYSADTKRMLEGWVVTPAQMDGVARTYRNCTVDVVRVAADLAVVRYRVEQRLCSPYLLRLENGAWKLDLAAMSTAIRFNHENQWHFVTPGAGRYAFAFDDWRFDRNGFPQAAN